MDSDPRLPSRTPAARPAAPERSLGELFRELAADSSRLFRQEIALARTELRRNVRALARDLARMGIGGAIALAGLLTLVVFVVALLGDVLGGEYWLSALLVGAVMLAGGAWLAYRAAADLRQQHLAPDETLDSLRVTRRWANREAQELSALIGGEPRAHGDGRPAASRAGVAPGAGVNRVRAQVSELELPPARPTARAGENRTQDKEEDKPGGGLLKRVFHEITADDIPGQAAKLAYYAFMSLPPTIMVVFSLTGIFGGSGAADWLTNRLQAALPESASELIENFVQQIVHDNAPAPLSIGLVLALWAASSVFVGLMVTLNHAYDIEDKHERSFVKKRLIAIGVLIAFTLLFLVASVALIGGPQVAEALGPGSTGELIWNIVHWPLAFAFVVAAFWVVYYVLPNRDQSACKGTLLKAAAAAALLWLVATAAFRFYVSNFGSYSETYGVLGAFIVLLLWLYITGLVVLAGGELASEMEERA